MSIKKLFKQMDKQFFSHFGHFQITPAFMHVLELLMVH